MDIAQILSLVKNAQGFVDTALNTYHEIKNAGKVLSSDDEQLIETEIRVLEDKLAALRANTQAKLRGDSDSDSES